MARADSVVSDNESYSEDVNPLEDDTMKSVKLNGHDSENGAEQEEDGSEEEYEIEEILKHRKGNPPVFCFEYILFDPS
jgi:hypothetical protein